MIKAVLIDVDNTLLDFDKYVKYAMSTGFEKFGFKQYEDWMYDEFCLINNAFWRAFEKGEIAYEEIMQGRWNKVFEKLGIVGDGIEFEKFFKDTLFYNAILIDGAIETLEYLSKKYIVCTATNGPHLQQLNRLKISGIEKYITHNFISEEMGVAKPDKAFFSLALERINQKQRENDKSELTFDNLIMIGDSLSSDMAGAKNSGIKTCFFDRNNKNNPFDYDYKITKLTQVKDIL